MINLLLSIIVRFVGTHKPQKSLASHPRPPSNNLLQQHPRKLAVQLSSAIKAQTNLAQENGQKLARSVREPNELLQNSLKISVVQFKLCFGKFLVVMIRQWSTQTRPMFSPRSHTLITNDLVLFKSISSLQERSQKLLMIVWELLSKMEDEER
ncbi:hypothetical protein M378DRAFT_19424 [Amanita muscaria Koide BX008]|uniref:NUA/TPR/MLP1-2-like domain-containing protein n=1 Tax=Amanita muscaria (strain Koide BX008) TaxID=946122 RepID=A0A0C2VYH5_AMAMK|nr:hypothetical protein M378DRAFT_19424 [Amanita muscaria Koide BX008]